MQSKGCPSALYNPDPKLYICKVLSLLAYVAFLILNSEVNTPQQQK